MRYIEFTSNLPCTLPGIWHSNYLPLIDIARIIEIRLKLDFRSQAPNKRDLKILPLVSEFYEEKFDTLLNLLRWLLRTKLREITTSSSTISQRPFSMNESVPSPSDDTVVSKKTSMYVAVAEWWVTIVEIAHNYYRMWYVTFKELNPSRFTCQDPSSKSC
jgi:hypothetical protein